MTLYELAFSSKYSPKNLRFILARRVFSTQSTDVRVVLFALFDVVARLSPAG